MLVFLDIVRRAYLWLRPESILVHWRIIGNYLPGRFVPVRLWLYNLISSHKGMFLTPYQVVP